MKSLLAAVLIVTSVAIHAQKRPFKFGKISDNEMNLSQCEFYPDAKSVILGEFGDLNFAYNDSKGWQYKMEVVVRVKVFDITEADQGNIKLRLYDPLVGSNKEELTEVKSYTYNRVGGEIQKNKINRNEVFEKRINDFWVQKSFAVPNIKAGTVFEYSYTILSDYIFNLTEWKFQKELPSYYNEFEYVIPEFFNYQSSILGNSYNLNSNESSQNESFTYSYSTLGAGLSGGSQIAGGGGAPNRKGSIPSMSKKTKMVMTNIPPIEDEPHQTNISDIPSRVEFQLISTNFPWQGIKLIATNYESFNKRLLSSENFGWKLNKGDFIETEQLGLSDLSAMDKALAVYNYHVNHFTWNGYNATSSSKAGKEAQEAGEGNVADINLSLISALRHAGVEAYPVILSTRGNGTIHPVYPSYAQFNYVIGLVSIEGKTYFLDAASKYPFGMIPIKCRNGKAWMVTENGGQMIDMMTGANHRINTTNRCEIDGDEIKVASKKVLSDYAAIGNQKEDSVRTLTHFEDNLATGDFEPENIVLSKSQVGRTLEFNYETMEEISDEYYFQPIKEGTILENPFKRESRKSIIDFPYRQSWRVTTQITLPEGYTVELPEPARINLPGKKGSFSYLVTQNGNTVIINSSTRINATSFGIEEYPQLRQFYQMVADKNNELVLITR